MTCRQRHCYKDVWNRNASMTCRQRHCYKETLAWLVGKDIVIRTYEIETLAWLVGKDIIEVVIRTYEIETLAWLVWDSNLQKWQGFMTSTLYMELWNRKQERLKEAGSLQVVFIPSSLAVTCTCHCGGQFWTVLKFL